MDGHNQDFSSSGRRWLEYAIAILVAILIVLIVVLIADYRSLREETTINARESWVTTFIQEHGPITVDDVTLVRSWMTFDYLIKLFKLPPGYLKSALGITDVRYPRLTVSAWAKGAKLDSVTAMGTLQDALRKYLLDGTATST